MKKTLSILFLLFIAFTGCKKNSEEKAKNLLVGRWRATKIVLIEPEPATITPDASNAYIEFKEDGTFIDGDSPAGPRTWKYDANKMILTIGDDLEIRVNKLTKEELYLLYEEEDPQTKAKSKFEIYYEK